MLQGKKILRRMRFEVQLLNFLLYLSLFFFFMGWYNHLGWRIIWWSFSFQLSVHENGGKSFILFLWGSDGGEFSCLKSFLRKYFFPFLLIVYVRIIIHTKTQKINIEWFRENESSYGTQIHCKSVKHPGKFFVICCEWMWYWYTMSSSESFSGCLVGS